MVSLIYPTGVAALVNGAIGSWAGIVNGGVALVSILPWLGELSQLTGDAPGPIKDLSSALEELYVAADKNDYEAFQAAAEKIIQKIDALTREPSKDNFKNYSRFKSWETYLKPLTDLRAELQNVTDRGLDGYDTARLEGPLKAAVTFMNGEIRAHTGFLNKTLGTIAREAKKIAVQELSGVFGAQDEGLRIEPKLSPLQKLVYDLKRFRTNKDAYLSRSVSETLSNDLKALEEYHPHFRGVQRYVLDRIGRSGGSLADELDTHLVSFIREFMINDAEGERCIDGPDFHLAYYQMALRFNHVHRESIVAEEDIAGKKAWGRDVTRPDQEIQSAKEKATLFASVGYILELQHFTKLADFEPTRDDSTKTLARKVAGVIALIEEHPIIMMHPEFGPQIKALIAKYIDTGYRLNPSSLEGLQQAHRENHGNNFPQALLILRKVLSEAGQRSEREVSVIDRGLEALRTSAGQMGIPLPEAVMQPVERLARQVGSQVESWIGSPAEQETLPPFMLLERDLRMFRAERAERSEATMQRALDNDLIGIEGAYPQLEGITEFFRRERGLGRRNLDTMEGIVTQFLVQQVESERSPLHRLLEKHGDTFHQTLYRAMERRGQLREVDQGLRPAEQIAWGQALFARIGEVPAGVLWEAVELVLNIDNLEQSVRSLELLDHEATTPEELSRNIDVALGILESSPHIEGLDELLGAIHAQIQSYLDVAVRLSEDLSALDERAVNAEVDRAQRLVRERKPAEALKVLKALFDSGPLMQVVGKVKAEESPASAVAKMSADFEADRTHKEGKLTPAVDQGEIEREERLLAHNLSMFSTFKVISSYCGLDPQTSEQRFEEILQRIEKVSYDGSPEQLANKREREKIFMEELNKLMDQNSRVNFGFLNWLVFKLVKHFTSEFSKSLVHNAQSAMLNPSNQPLKGHHGIVRGINNGVLALLFAERIWKQDGTGEHGVNEKELKMIQILEGLNKGSQEKLIKQVVDKAIDEFPVGTFSQYRILNAIATFIMKFIARGAVHRMEIANTVLETMSDAIYSDKHINYNVDALLLKQIQEFEKILGEESGELVIKEGDNGKRLVTQLVDNLFTLLREKGEMTPGLRERQQASFIERLGTAMGEQTDNIIKGVVRDLIIFGYEQLQEKERMNHTLLDVLRHANRALRPSTTSLLRELYSDIPGVNDIPEAKLVARFEEEYRPDQPTGAVTRQECEAALQEKYRKIEQELHEALGRILNKGIKGVVVTQVQTHLKTPREAILEHIKWLNEQFDPYHAHAEKKRAYTEEMKSLVVDAFGQKSRAGRVDPETKAQIDARHKKLLIQLKNQLALLKIKETEDPSKGNLQIKRLYKATQKLVNKLERVNGALIEEDYQAAYRELNDLELEMKALRGELKAIQVTLSWENLSGSEKATETAYSVARRGAEAATPAVRSFLGRWITPLAEESVALYKSRAAFKAMVDQAVFRSYLEYQPSPDSPDHTETVAEDFGRTWQKGWEVVGSHVDSYMSPSCPPKSSMEDQYGAPFDMYASGTMGLPPPKHHGYGFPPMMRTGGAMHPYQFQHPLIDLDARI
ncbi:MAG: hypothetical protein H7A41_05620 [Chlamydiales bacterium]|nr:hypothetical protein [Chlamydiales bacterium]